MMTAPARGIAAARRRDNMKIILRLVLVLLAVVILAGLAVFFYVDAVAKRAVERGATTALGVETRLASADVQIFRGGVVLAQLDVANPKGFSSPHFLKLGSGDTAVSFATLRKPTIELPHLTLTGVDVNLQRNAGGSNYQIILDHLKGSETSGGPPGGTPSSEPATKYVIRDVTIRDILVHVDLLGIDLGKLDLKIDEIKLKDVGSDTTGGMLMSELSGTILKAVLAAAIEKGKGIVPQDLINDLGGRLGDLKSLESLGVDVLARQAGEEFEKVNTTLEELRGKVQDITKDLPVTLPADLDKPLKDLGDLIPGGKKDR
jgi:hypothetical protein